MNPFEPPRTAVTGNRRAFIFFQRPTSTVAFAGIFAAIFIAALFIPTVEIFQLNHSLGHVPLYCAYMGVFIPEYRIIAMPIVVAHFIGTIVLASVIERMLNAWMRM
jgi:hypothetical protein